MSEEFPFSMNGLLKGSHICMSTYICWQLLYLLEDLVGQHWKCIERFCSYAKFAWIQHSNVCHFNSLLGRVQFCMWILFQPGDFGIETSSMVSASMADWLVTKAQKSWIPNVDFQLPCGMASRRRLLCCWLVPAWMLRMLCCAMCWAPRKHGAVSVSRRVDGTLSLYHYFCSLRTANHI